MRSQEIPHLLLDPLLRSVERESHDDRLYMNSVSVVAVTTRGRLQALTPGAPYTWVKPSRGWPGTCRAPAAPLS